MSDPIAVQLRALADQLDARAPAAPAAPADPLAGTFLNIAGAVQGYQPPSAEPADGSWHWEKNNQGWIKVAGKAPAISAQRQFSISATPYYLKKTGAAADPSVSDLVDAWNAIGGGGVSGWRAANANFDMRFPNALGTITRLLVEQYPASVDDINWSSESAAYGA